MKNQHELEAIHKALAIVEFDILGSVISANATFLKIFGYTLPEIVGKPHEILLPERQRNPDEEKKVWENFSKGQCVTGDFKRVGKDKTEFWIRASYSPLLDDNGRATSILKVAMVVGREIEKILEIESGLRTANLAMQSQKEALERSAIVAETDTEGHITYVNENFSAVSQYSKEELIGKSHQLLNSGFHPSSFFSDLWKTISDGRVWRGEVKNRAKDGSFFWLDTTIYPIKDANNTSRGFAEIRFDITEKKRALEELESAMQKAVVADKAKSDFLYTMSHEIRTPLNGIIGMTSLLQETTLTQEQEEYAETISQSGKTLLTIINDILDFSKIEAGRMEL